jgi:hypothetical protein
MWIKPFLPLVKLSLSTLRIVEAVTSGLLFPIPDDSADNSAHILSLTKLELSSSLLSVTLAFEKQIIVVFACISLDQVTFRRTLPSHVGRLVLKIVTRARVFNRSHSSTGNSGINMLELPENVTVIFNVF